MLHDSLSHELGVTETFFTRVVGGFDASHGSYRPQPEMYTVAGHIHHVATTVTWFVDGAFRRADGFAMNFEDHIAESHAATDFDQVCAMVREAFADARAVINAQSEAELMQSLPAGPIMGGAPKMAVVSGIADHTAHHRGALGVYCRLLGNEVPMPYL